MNDVKVNKARALYYGLFSRFFVFTTDTKRYLELISLIDILKDNPLDTTTNEAFENIRKVLKSDSNIEFMKEFDDIFHSPESKTVRTTASYYDENIESGKKRVEMQNFLAKTKIRRDEKKYSDHEDHIGFIFTVMNELCELAAQGEEQYINTAHCIFEQILNEFVNDFSKEIYEHPSSDIFKNVIIILKAFMEFERIYLEVSIPLAKQRVVKQETQTEELSDAEKERRARNRALRASGPKKEQKEVFVASEAEDDI